MRVLEVGTVRPETGSLDPGGLSTHVEALSHRLEEKGHSVEILAMGRFIRPSARTRDGIAVRGIPFPGASALSGARAGWHARRRGRSVRTALHRAHAWWRGQAIAGEWDLYHVHAPYNQMAQSIRAARPDGSIVLTVHSYHHIERALGSRRAEAIQVAQEAFDASDAVIHVSSADREVGRRLGLRIPEREAVIPHAVSSGPTRVRRWRDRRRAVAFVGNLLEIKRPELLVQAFADLSRDGTELLIVGDGPLKQRLKRKCAGLPVRFLGHLSPPKCEEVLGEVECLVVPSASESFGLVYAEAAVRGTPVIGYEATVMEMMESAGLPEQLHWTMTPFPPSAGAGALGRKLGSTLALVRASDDRSQELANKMRNIFDWERVLNDVEEVYEFASGLRADLRTELREGWGSDQ